MTRRIERRAKPWARAVVLGAMSLWFAGDARAQSSGGGPLNLLHGLFSGTQSKGTQPAPSPQRPAGPAHAQTAPAPGPSAPLPWSGEDGASGHPLMTAGAIREAAANFDGCVSAGHPRVTRGALPGAAATCDGCVAAMCPDAARRNISQDNFQRFTAGLS